MSSTGNPDYDRGVALLHTPDLAEALAALDAAAAKEPGRARIHANRALALAHLPLVVEGEARAAAEQACALAPDDGYGWACAAHVARCEGRWDAALEAAQRGVDRAAPGPIHAWATRELAWALIELGQGPRALGLANRLGAAEPQHAETASLRAHALMVCERPGEALRAMDVALALAPDDPELPPRRAELAAEVDALAGPLARAHAATTARPLDADAWHDLGVLLVKAGELNEAREAFDQARSTHPDPSLRADPTVPLSRWEAIAADRQR